MPQHQIPSSYRFSQQRPPVDDSYPDEAQITDLLGLYLHEIKQIPLLLPEQEKNLAYQVQAGNHEARQALIVANLPLVVSVARRFQGHGLELLDLIQEGTFGLMRAVEKFDPARGKRFSTMATWWIRSAIQVAIAAQGKPIRIPISLLEKQQRLIRQQTQVSAEAARIEEQSTLDELIQRARDVVSLDAPFPADSPDPRTLAEILADPGATKDLETIENESSHVVQQLLQTLPYRERQVLILHLGLDGNKPLTLRQIGHALGLSSEGVRLIERRALERLRRKARESRL
jgi:RNA polymerase sigma factor (sigma-70 family)